MSDQLVLTLRRGPDSECGILPWPRRERPWTPPPPNPALSARSFGQTVGLTASFLPSRVGQDVSILPMPMRPVAGGSRLSVGESGS